MPITYDRKTFFDAVRDSVFLGALTDGQVAGMTAMLLEWEVSQPTGDTRQLAYAFGTTRWETGSTMLPIHEYGSADYFTRMYDPQGSRPQVARMLGNTEPGDGVRFAGRGLCQTTGRRNYTWASTIVGQDCVADPDLLLRPEWACKVLFAGMIGGHYTGKKLADYFHGAASDWLDARRIINGTDHAADVAALAEHFFAALKASLVFTANASQTAAVTKPATIVVAAAPPVAAAAAAPAPQARAPSLLARLASSLFG